MDKATLLCQLKLDEKMIECIYLFGSHAYGTASEQRQSDYDIVMVLKSRAFDAHELFKWRNVNWLTRHNWINPNFRHFFSGESDKTCFFDLGDREAPVWMYNVDTFCMLLRTNTMFAIECISLPEKLKWIEKRNFSDEFCIDDKMLEQSVINHSRSHLFMACKNMTQILFPAENDDMETRDEIEKMSKDPIWNHTQLPNNYNFYKTKKLIWHSIRLLYFGINIKRFNRLTDYTGANYLYEDLLAMESHKWIDFDKKYMPTYTELTNEFINLTRDALTLPDKMQL
ncbi:unnamed protein product [Didymodactylos carnosus]|uniref:Polymerase nucleotidyl transferase domain-containing protein n=1 Tax=Didymodactylos carnosus TaxID=1234261 RepID=A0A814M5U1_9BILA|nr:unnamed protein product [Didymodactylos carnosus]CAF1074148.1 unnamed protein product [Didymodactylos carnosus]CAF3764089.1 unnamed protein product [Didymodactylos carnosus]CAF3840906.1 unnamed protein product [Didymodactylos carnosus]